MMEMRSGRLYLNFWKKIPLSILGQTHSREKGLLCPGAVVLPVGTSSVPSTFLNLMVLGKLGLSGLE
jgi:hypothetical protein